MFSSCSLEGQGQTLGSGDCGCGAPFDVADTAFTVNYRYRNGTVTAAMLGPANVLVEALRDRLIVTPYGPLSPDGDPVPLTAEGSQGCIRPAGFVITPDG